MSEFSEHLPEAGAEGDYALDMRGCAGAESASDFDGRTALAALCERDRINAALVGLRMPGCTLGDIERGRHGALAGLRAKLRVADAGTGNELNEFQR